MATRKRSSSATTTQLPSQAAIAAANREPPRYVDSVQFPSKYLQNQHDAPWQRLEGSELMQTVSEGLEFLLKTRPEFPVAELARFLKQRKQERDEGTVNTVLSVANTRATALEAQKARDEKRKPIAVKQQRVLKPFTLPVKLAAHSSLAFVDVAAVAVPSASATPSEATLSLREVPSQRNAAPTQPIRPKKTRYIHSVTATFTPFPRTDCADPVLKSQMELVLPASPSFPGSNAAPPFGATATAADASPKTNSPLQPLPNIAIDIPPQPLLPASPVVPPVTTAPVAPSFVTCGPIPLFGLLKPVEAALNELFARIQSDGYSHVRVIAAQGSHDVIYIDGHPHMTDLRARIAENTGSNPSTDNVLGWAIEALLETNSDVSCHSLSETVQTSAMTQRVKVVSHLDVGMSERSIVSNDTLDKVAASLFDKPPVNVDLARIAVVVISHVDREALSQLLTTAYCVMTSQWKMAQVARLRRADSEALDSRDVEKEHHDAEAKIALLSEAHEALVERRRDRDERRRKLTMQLKMQLNGGGGAGAGGDASAYGSPSASFVKQHSMAPVDVHKALDGVRLASDARGRRRERNDALFVRMIDAERSRAVALIKNVVRKFLERKRAKRRKSVAMVSFGASVTAPTPSSNEALAASDAAAALALKLQANGDSPSSDQPLKSSLASGGAFSSSRGGLSGPPPVSDQQNHEYERNMNYDIIKHIVKEGLVKYPDLLMTETPLPPPLPRQVAVWSYAINRRKAADEFDVSSEDESWTPDYKQRTYLPPLTTRHTNINARVTVIQAMIDCDCDWRKFLFNARVLHAGVAAIQKRATRMLSVIAHWMMLLTYSALRSGKSAAVNGPAPAGRGAAAAQPMTFLSWMKSKHAGLTTMLQHLSLTTSSIQTDLTTASEFDDCPLKEEGPGDLAQFLLMRLPDPLDQPQIAPEALGAALWLEKSSDVPDDDIVNTARVSFSDVVVKYAPPRPPRWSTYAAPHELESPYLARQVHPRAPIVLCPAGASSKALHLLAVTLGMNAASLSNAAPAQPGGLLVSTNSAASNKPADISVNYGSGMLGMRHVPLHPQLYYAATHPHGSVAKDMTSLGTMSSADPLIREISNGSTTGATAAANTNGTPVHASSHNVTWYVPLQHPLLYVTGRPYALVMRCATKGQFANAAIRVVASDKKSNSGVLVPKPPRQGVVTAPQFRSTSTSGIEKSMSLDATASSAINASQVQGANRELAGSAAPTDASAEESIPAEHPAWPDVASNPPNGISMSEVTVSVVDHHWLGQSLAAIEARGQQDIENNLSQCDGLLGRFVMEKAHADPRTAEVRTEAIRILRSKRPPQKAEDGKVGDASAADRRKARQSARTLTVDNPPSPVILTGVSAHPHPPVHAPLSRAVSRKDSAASATNSAPVDKSQYQRNSSTTGSPFPAPPPPLPASATDGPVVQPFATMVEAVLPLPPLEPSHAINLQALLPCTHTVIRNPRFLGLNETITAVSDLVVRLPPNPSSALGYRMVMMIHDPETEFVLPAAATLAWFARCTVTNDGPARICVDEINAMTSSSLEQSLRDSRAPTVAEDDGKGRDITFSDDEDDLNEDPTMVDAHSESDVESTAKPLFATVTLSSAKRDDASLLRKAAVAAANAKLRSTVPRLNTSTSKPVTHREASKVPLPLRPLACLSKLQDLPELRSVDFQIDDAQLVVSAFLLRSGLYDTIRKPIDRILSMARGATPLPATLPEQKHAVLMASRAFESFAILVFLQCYLTSAAWAEHADRTFENFIQYHAAFGNALRYPKLLEGEIATPVFMEGLFKDTDVSHGNPKATPSSARGSLPKHPQNNGSSTARGVHPSSHHAASSGPSQPPQPWPLLHPRLLPLDFDRLMSVDCRWESKTHVYALT